MIPERFYPYSIADTQHHWRVYVLYNGEWLQCDGSYDHTRARQMLRYNYHKCGERFSFMLEHFHKPTGKRTPMDMLEAKRTS